MMFMMLIWRIQDALTTGDFHTVHWLPLAEFQQIMKQECPIWVEVQKCPSMYWPLLHD